MCMHFRDIIQIGNQQKPNDKHSGTRFCASPFRNVWRCAASRTLCRNYFLSRGEKAIFIFGQMSKMVESSIHSHRCIIKLST